MCNDERHRFKDVLETSYPSLRTNTMTFVNCHKTIIRISVLAFNVNCTIIWWYVNLLYILTPLDFPVIIIIIIIWNIFTPVV